ncbi:MAG: uroporphyrin-III C-methyltransferase, partial [Pseudomonadota bacterium]|nr:uroporphyrin-III C-methyltransferase [Pseudomonadota bacterium]
MSEENSKSVEAAVTVAEAPGAAEPVSPSATQAPTQPAVQPAVAAANAAPTASRSATWQNPWLWVAAGALALSGWQWIETRLRLADTQQEL